MARTKKFMKTRILMIVFLLILVSVGILVGCASRTFGVTSVVVVQPGQSIAQAVDGASAGDSLFIKSGFYSESLIIVNKSLSISGESALNTIIDGGATAQVIFLVVASNVQIKNVTLQNTNMDPFAKAPAVRIYDVTGVNVQNVTIRNVAVGVELRSSNFSQISRCKIFSSGICGAYLREKSCNNIIVGNTIADNNVGILLADDASQDNKMFHNSFVNNSAHVSSFGGVNYFDNGYPSGGNYWDSDVSVDLKSGISQNQNGSDGILDQGFSFDNYPLVNPLTSLFIDVAGQGFVTELSANFTLTNWRFNATDRSLYLTVSNQQINTYAARVEIPKSFLSCDNLSAWTIFLHNADLKRTQYLGVEDTANTYLYFVLNNVTGAEIQIVATTLLPELSFPFAAVTIVVLTSVIMVLYRKRTYRS